MPTHAHRAQAGSLAQKRLARGLQLNQTEATALIASVLQERIRDGKHSVAELMQLGKTLLGTRHVLPGVSVLLHEIQVEGSFHDGCAWRRVSRLGMCLRA
jgi:urease